MNISHLKIGDKFWVRHRKRYYQALEVERQERIEAFDFCMYDPWDETEWDYPEESLDGCDLPDCPICFAASKFLCADAAVSGWRAETATKRLSLEPEEEKCN